MNGPLPLLSKSRFVAGLQCHRLLWWRAHDREAPELRHDEGTQAVLDRGTHVGDLARSYVPGGVLVDVDHGDFAGRIRATADSMARGAKVVYEAAFSADGVFVAVDILEQVQGAWRVIEVKSSTRVKPEHLPDVAVQVHVLRAAGLTVLGADVMVLNRECRFPHLENLFRREDVTQDVEARLPHVAREIRAQRRMLAGPLPDVSPGDHCDSPYACSFVERCCEPAPEFAVETLYRLGKPQRAFLEEKGYATILDLPGSMPLTAVQDRQRRAVHARELVVDWGLGEALRPFQGTLAFLDFETVQLAIPRWDGCRPYDQVPVQMSCHVLGPGGRVTHQEWIADGPEDPREAIARAILKATDGADRVVAYSVSFERARIEELAVAVPRLRRRLRALADRLIDLLPVVSGHVYHPEFRGSFGLKSVVRGLLPDLAYDDLDVADGQTASRELERLMFAPTPLPERTRLRQSLLAYCQRDTWALVRLLGMLRVTSPRFSSGSHQSTRA